MAADILAQLGDALDAEQELFRAMWPHRPLWHALFAGRTIEPAFNAYRAAVRAEVAERPTSRWCHGIEAETIPDPPTSLRQFVDAEAQRRLSSRRATLQSEWHRQFREHCEIVVRRYPRRKPRIRRL